MKIAACLGTKDEVELVGPAIDHLRAIGVHHIIASDAGSTDGTEGFLRSRIGRDFDLFHLDDRNPDPLHEKRETERIVTRARDTGADWLIFLDADEFPLPATGRLADAVDLAAADVLLMDRFNVPLLADGPAVGLPPDFSALKDLLLYAPGMSRQETQARVRQDPDAPWIGVIPAPKVMIRLATVDTTAEGCHDATRRDGSPHGRVVPRDLIVAHVPFSTERRFARKIANIKTVVSDSGDRWGPHSAWHWKRWLDNVEKRGGVAGEMARNRLNAVELAELQRAGVVRSAAEILSRKDQDQAAGNGAR